MLTLIKDLGLKLPSLQAARKRRYGIYLCNHCNNEFETRTDAVLSGATKNCSSCNNIKHGLTKHLLYNTWSQEKKRCYSPTNKDYDQYGKRGITVSKEFHDFKVWLTYVESLPNAYKENYTIDRINNNGNYERGNLRWTTKSIQAQNQICLSKNNTSGYKGVSKDKDKWRTVIWVSNKKISLGRFTTKLDAARAYDQYVIDNKLKHTLNGVLNE